MSDTITHGVEPATEWPMWHWWVEGGDVRVGGTEASRMLALAAMHKEIREWWEYDE